MKVISEGPTYPEWELELTCKKCQCRFSVDEADYRAYVERWAGTCFQENFPFKCPQCSWESAVSPKVIPYIVQKRVNKKGWGYCTSLVYGWAS